MAASSYLADGDASTRLTTFNHLLISVSTSFVPELLRVRQEALAAAVRSPAALEAHLPSAGSSSSSSQRRKQGLPQHRDAHYTER